MFLHRANPHLEDSLSDFYFDYKPGKLTVDVAMARKYPITAAKAEGPEKVCIGFDMSKVFDTVPRERFLELLAARGVDTGNVKVIKNNYW